MEEIRRTDEVLQDLISEPAALFRPPFGKITPAKLWALWRGGFPIVLWNRDFKDFAAADPRELRSRMIQNPLDSGDILLLHDTAAATADVLEDLIRVTRRAGLDFATVDQWVGVGRPLAGAASAS
jgi:peptidoglycan/xylan/chitin deacetylase (PgdA/CDA1 family)